MNELKKELKDKLRACYILIFKEVCRAKAKEINLVEFVMRHIIDFVKENGGL